ncbi:hypothetical protein M2459_000628 [Parabacteroides sp. PF5-5]|uniref:hypothetical protein n=1 Tax=unclassified Parabacteroides TaxID=2649774 RepID=UPI0024758986|nr:MULTISPECIES: hypothetical protein [unclassified Parabacteroides]MDH6303438.1 hypothetical protein [Parabacteroides sp. PH5-39]MDH6314761.1 hypothetical protein [Parabacteroides sp. PF5-13]MDH6318098.1 hypothetical protein [Parabacteroides sp. PH5-13]MDH6321971.1 hypothetical protein [Parabacteroides sp. PH5-8]MDH6326094.1 hypothetical protein [Parabacteroides sp. PH5-41]
MKKFVFIYVCIMAVSLVSTNTYAQNDVPQQQLAAAVSRLDTARTAKELQEVRNLFQRISINYPSDWMAAYYLAYTNINIFFREDNPATKKQLIEEARMYLDKIKREKGLSVEIRSEISTLSGYSYYALMSVDPQTNGPKYSSHVVSAYAEALKLNPNNPRAILLNAYFQQSLSSFMGGSYTSFESDKEKAKLLHEQEKKDTPIPHWWVEIKM